MKCKVPFCFEDAAVFIVDHNTYASIRHIRPGQIIECEDPQSVEGYCEWCWGMKQVFFPTPSMRWPEGAEL